MSDDGVARRAPTRVEIVAVPSTQISTLRNLFQFYEYDFSEIEGARIGEDGRFHHLDNAAFEEVDFVDPKWGPRPLQRFSTR